jgi:hypothetical protein
MSIILAWLAPHALSLIMPVIVMVAADANEHSPPIKPVRTKPLQMLFMSRSIVCPRGESVSSLSTSLQERSKLRCSLYLLSFGERSATGMPGRAQLPI